MHALVIKGGRVVDGSGMPSFIGDVAVKGGKIVEVGHVSPGAAKTIDAAGLIVSPGFVDIHTHYDAQAFWDPLVTPSSWNGITTVVTGNCGFTLAPVRARDQEYLVKTLAGVEAISVTAIEKGVQFQWSSYADFVKALDTPKGVNIACNIGHTAVRRYVMGEHASDGPATEKEVGEMAALVREALAAGAWCFTTSRGPAHWGPKGEPVPSRTATYDELWELCMAVREFPNCGLEMIGTQSSQEGRDFMARVSKALACQVNWNEFNIRPKDPDEWRMLQAYMEEANRQGAQVYGISRCQNNDMEFDLNQNTGMITLYPHWPEVMTAPLPEKMRLLRQPEVRARLREGMGTRFGYDRAAVWESSTGKYRHMEGKLLTDLAQEQGKHPLDVMLDTALDEGLRTEFALTNQFSTDYENVAKVLRSPYSILGISDGGAHLNMFCGAMYTTYFLDKWVRERQVFTMEEAIKKLTFIPASIIGFHDRGLLRPGMAADIVLFDADTVKPKETHRVHDLPGGDPRLVADAEGIAYTIVGGQVVLDHGKHTGALPGRLIRSGDYR